MLQFFQNFRIPVSYLTTLAFIVVLCGCETWSVTLTENIDWECSRTGCWGWCLDLRDGEVQEPVETCVMRSVLFLCSSPNIIKVIDEMNGDEMDGACGKHGGEKTYVYTFGFRAWRMELLGRLGRRRKDNIENGCYRPAFLKLCSADHKRSSGSALVVLLDWTLVQKRQKR